MEENVINKPKEKSIKKNYFYNLIYQLFLVIVPILVTPYLARILNADGTGKYAYTYSYVTYFTLVASLGFGFYAQRLIARDRDDKHKQSVDFWEVVIARLIPSIITIIVYFVLTSLNVYGDAYNTLMIFQSFHLIAVIFDITFLLQGNEEFGKIALRNFIIKALSIASIFIFVKKYEDLWIYVLIQSLTILLSNISLWLYLPKMLDKVKLKELNIWRHFIPSIILFLPQIATSVYVVLDKTLIGLITHDDSFTGNYNNAQKLIQMSQTVITSLGAVFVSRNSALIKQGKMDHLKSNINIVIKFVFFVSIPMILGIIAVSDNLMPWYLGQNYGTENTNQVIVLMKILSPIIVIIGLSNVFGLQLLIPLGKDIKFTLAVTTGSIVNLILNLILIPRIGAYGAAIGTICAELCVTIIMLCFVHKYFNLIKIILSSWKCIVAGVIMFVACYFEAKYFPSNWKYTALIIFTGISVYFIILLLLREKMLTSSIKSVWNKLKK